MKNYKKMYVELCKSFIKDFFAEHCKVNGGVETDCFWNEAKKSGLWVRKTYGTAMSVALEELTTVEPVSDDTGKYLFSVFKLK